MREEFTREELHSIMGLDREDELISAIGEDIRREIEKEINELQRKGSQ